MKNRYNLQKEPLIKLIFSDLLVICTILTVFAYFHLFREEVIDSVPTFVSSSDTARHGPAELVSSSDEAGDDGFDSSFFTKETTVTDSSYTSPYISVTITDGTFVKDNGAQAEYHLADIYVRDITCLRTVFAKDQYGKYVLEETPHMAERTGAVCAINGDYYGTAWKNLIIRNGVMYGKEFKSDDVCVLYTDGTMKTYSAAAVDCAAELEKGAWQLWSFGPSLLDPDGNTITEFKSPIRNHNPRSVVGYYEPGHYCFIAVDGRLRTSAGLTLKELSALCGQLGLKCAYNLDGGQTSVMTFTDRLANQPFHGGRNCSDFICVFDYDTVYEPGE